MYKPKFFSCLFLVVLIVSIPGFLFAGPDLYLGLTGGLNRSQLTTDANFSTFGPYNQAALNLNGGISVLMQFERWGVETGLGYSQAGAKTESMVGTTESGAIRGEFWISQEQSYLQVPILASYSFNRGGFNPYLFAGPNIRFLLNGKEKMDSDYGEQEWNREIDGYLNDVNIALESGAGVRYAVTPVLNMGISASYLFGLNNQLSSNAYGEQKARDFRFNFSLYYLL